jgi:hypothetical protein
MGTKQILALVVGAAAIGGLIGAGAILLTDSEGDEALPPATEVTTATTTLPPAAATTLSPAATTTLPAAPEGFLDRLIYVEQVNRWMTRIEGVQSTIGPGADLAVFDAAIGELDEVYAEVQAYELYDGNEWFYDEDLIDENVLFSAFPYICGDRRGGRSSNPIEEYAWWVSNLAWWDSALAGAPNDQGAVADEPDEIERVLDLRLLSNESVVACRESTETWLADTEQIAAIYDFER